MNHSSPHINGNKVQFHFFRPGVSHASVAGSFNNWDAFRHPMSPGVNSGDFSISMYLPIAGEYHYKFVLNGQEWLKDPANYQSGKNLEFYENSIFFIHHHAPLDREIHTWRNIQHHPHMGFREVEFFNHIDPILVTGPSPSHPQIRAYFLEQFEYGLKLFAHAPLWSLLHIYNMGFLWKCPAGVFGFDVVSTQNVWGVYWEVPPHLKQALIETIDVLFVSHHHPDHYDRELAERLLHRGKGVVTPAWDNQNFPPVGIRPLPDLPLIIPQARTKFAATAWKGHHVYRDSNDLPLAVYEIKFPGGGGLIHTNDHDYTRPLARPASPTDTLIMKYGGVHPRVGAVEAAFQALAFFQPKKLVLAHLQELGHPPQGGRIPYGEALKFKGRLPPSLPTSIPFWGDLI